MSHVQLDTGIPFLFDPVSVVTRHPRVPSLAGINMPGGYIGGKGERWGAHAGGSPLTRGGVLTRQAPTAPPPQVHIPYGHRTNTNGLYLWSNRTFTVHASPGFWWLHVYGKLVDAIDAPVWAPTYLGSIWLDDGNPSSQYTVRNNMGCCALVAYAINLTVLKDIPVSSKMI